MTRDTIRREVSGQPNGATVTLTATPGDGCVLTGWEGGGCSGVDSCVVTMNENVTVTATFRLVFPLHLTLIGDGSGVVRSNPAGIVCGEDCQEAYAAGVEVTLTAAPDVGSVFTGWSGGGCSGMGECVVTMTENATITATFEPSPSEGNAYLLWTN